jgi:hypothetical protein
MAAALPAVLGAPAAVTSGRSFSNGSNADFAPSAERSRQSSDHALPENKASDSRATTANLKLRPSCEVAHYAASGIAVHPSDRGRDCSCEQPPAQTRACSATAHGSYLG